MVGPWYAKQEVAGKVHPDQGNAQPCGQFQGHQRQRQRLPALARQHLGQQGRPGTQGHVVVLVEVQLVHAPQQGLGQLDRRQVRQAGGHQLQQAAEIPQDLLRHQLRVMLGG
ncbi:hypothetical protein D9M68_932830 [compost metagenome]